MPTALQLVGSDQVRPSSWATENTTEAAACTLSLLKLSLRRVAEPRPGGLNRTFSALYLPKEPMETLDREIHSPNQRPFTIAFCQPSVKHGSVECRRLRRIARSSSEWVDHTTVQQHLLYHTRYTCVWGPVIRFSGVTLEEGEPGDKGYEGTI